MVYKSKRKVETKMENKKKTNTEHISIERLECIYRLVQKGELRETEGAKIFNLTSPGFRYKCKKLFT